MKIGSHVGMSGKEMFLGSVKEALSYGAAVWPVRRSFVLTEIERVLGKIIEKE